MFVVAIFGFIVAIREKLRSKREKEVNEKVKRKTFIVKENAKKVLVKKTNTGNQNSSAQKRGKSSKKSMGTPLDATSFLSDEVIVSSLEKQKAIKL